MQFKTLQARPNRVVEGQRATVMMADSEFRRLKNSMEQLGALFSFGLSGIQQNSPDRSRTVHVDIPMLAHDIEVGEVY